MNELALFAGAGGGILGGHLLGWETICAIERDAYAAQILAQRQNDGILRPFPIWSDVTTFDGRPWRGLVDVVSGGFPCQDISAAGKGAGITGARSGMWKEMARIIGEVRPRFVFVENSPMLTSRGLGVVLGDLAALGYDTERDVISAADCGADHLRERLWIVCSNPHGYRLQRGEKSDASKRWNAHNGRIPALVQGIAWPDISNPHAYGSNDGLANRVDRTRAVGNGQVPAVAATAFELLRARFE